MLAEQIAPEASSNEDFATPETWAQFKPRYLASLAAYMIPVNAVAKVREITPQQDADIEAVTAAHRPVQEQLRDFPVTNHADLLEKLNLLGDDLFGEDDVGEVAIRDMGRIAAAPTPEPRDSDAALAAVEAECAAIVDLQKKVGDGSATPEQNEEWERRQIAFTAAAEDLPLTLDAIPQRLAALLCIYGDDADEFLQEAPDEGSDVRLAAQIIFSMMKGRRTQSAAASGAYSAAKAAYDAADAAFRQHLAAHPEQAAEDEEGDHPLHLVRTARRDAADELFEVQPSSIAELEEQLRIQLFVMEGHDHETPESPELVRRITDRANYFDDRLIVEMIIRLQHLAGPIAPAPGPTEWDDAVAAYEAAIAKRKAEVPYPGKDHADFFATVDDDLVELNINVGRCLRWTSDRCLLGDITLSSRDKKALLPRFRDADARRSALRNADADNGAAEALYDAEQVAEDRMMAAPPPDTAALARKTLHAANWEDDDRLGYDDLGRVAFLAHGYVAQRNAVTLAKDILKAGGLDHPMLRMEDFSPSAWIDAFNDTGGKVSAPGLNGELLLVDDHSSPERAALRDQLLQTPWKARAVLLEAEDRREHGSDPLVDSRFGHGHQDRRSAAGAFYGPVRRGDLISFGIKPGTKADFVLHVRHIDNRPAEAAQAAA